MRRSTLYHFTSFFTFVVDLAIISFSFVLSYKLRFHSQLSSFLPKKGVPPFSEYVNLLYIIVVIFAIIFVYKKFASFTHRSGFDEFVNVVNIISTGMVILLALTFMYRQFEYSRVVILLSWILSIIFIFLFHSFVRVLSRYILRKIFGRYKVVVVGESETSLKVIEILKKLPQVKVYYSTVLDKNKLISFIQKRKINEVILAQSVEQNLVAEISDEVIKLGVAFKIVPDIIELRLGEVCIDTYLGIPLLEIKPISLSGSNFYIKRVLDIFLSILILSFSIVPMLIISLLIMLDSPGPAIFLQDRIGYRGKKFKCYKFRSMVKDAERLFEQLKDKSERGKLVFKMKSDPRVTRVGKFLRRYSIDELPQIINVLRGEMSLVGPRPQIEYEARSVFQHSIYKRRYNVLPGITGLWQVSGRADLDFEDMMKLDLYYVEYWSLGLDLQIMFKTIFAIFSKKGAY